MSTAIPVAWTAGCLAEDDLLSFLRGGLSADQLERATAHVEGCAACFEILRISAPSEGDALAHVAALRLRASEPPPGFDHAPAAARPDCTTCFGYGRIFRGPGTDSPCPACDGSGVRR